MRIAVIGAGIVGVTTAYELGLDGHAVTVFERHGTVAEASSFAPAGVLAPGHVAPWAAPGLRTQVLSQWLAPHRAVRLRWPLDADDWRWMARWWRACRLDTYLAHRRQMHLLAAYSHVRLDAISARLRLEFERSDGCLVLLRTERDLKLAQPGLQLLRDLGVKVQQLDAAQARKLEPALHEGTPLCAALVSPDDGVGNCRQFAWLLRDEARQRGVAFRFGAAVRGLDRGSGTGWTLRLDREVAEGFDAVVVCAGAASVLLLRPLGLHTRLVAVHGHSVSAYIRQPLDAPRSGVIDQQLGVAIVRQGQRVRIAGGAELGGQPDRKSPAALRTLYKALQDWFPGAATLVSGVQEWKGAYPVLPDGPPLVGASPLPGLWLNTGHGSAGWAMACGSARVLADRVLGHSPEIDTAGLEPAARLG